ncbi:MAG: hypothetical protein JO142_17605 [Burkholderiales bacterium]|nr:hypothetical protein [Burkholderiales bacterium]
MFDEVLAAHFSMISRQPFPHVLIERQLLQMAGDASKANKFRADVLAAAGWRHSSLVSFGKYPDEAAVAFNRIRAALHENIQPSELLDALHKQG